MIEHILSENELHEAYDEIKSINEKISSLKDRKGEIDKMLEQSASNKAKARYPGIEFGDKVKVIRRTYDPKNPDATTAIIGYMGNYFIDRRFVFDDFYDRNKVIMFELFQVKKDGTRSLKKDDIYFRDIVSIEKVEE